jgi:hypothetical protein
MGFLLSIGGCQVSYKILIRDHAPNEAKGSKLIGGTRAHHFLSSCSCSATPGILYSCKPMASSPFIASHSSQAREISPHVRQGAAKS